MSAKPTPALSNLSLRILVAWAAGFLATLIFHQGAVWLANKAGLSPFGAFNMAARPPYGVPAVFALAFWGGVWGIVFVLIDPYLPRMGPFWLRALAFGAIYPMIGTWLIFQPMRGQTPFTGFRLDALPRMMTFNAAWGLGTALLYQWIAGRVGTRARA